MAPLKRYTHAQLQEWLETHVIAGGAPGGYIGNGTRVGYSASSPQTWKKLEQVLEAVVATFDSTKVDTTVHGNGGFMSNIPGLIAVSDTTVKLLRDHSSTTAPNQNALYALALAKSTVWLRIEIPDGPDLATALWEAFEYQVRVSRFAPSTPINDKQSLDLSFTFSGTTFTKYPLGASVLGAA